MALIGLTNENEFYSDHYLAEIFSGDIRGVLEEWQRRETEAREAAKSKARPGAKYRGYRTPANRLNGKARDLLQRIENLERRRNPMAALMLARGLARRLLGRDPMQMKKWKRGQDSVFYDRNHHFTASDVEHPY